MRTAIALFIILILPGRAYADEVTRYHNQVIAADVAALGLMFGGYERDADAVTVSGLGLGISGAPIVHLAHGNLRSAAKSLALRVTLPLATAWFGNKVHEGISVCAIGTSGSSSGCKPSSRAGALWGFAIGLIASTVIDGTKFASKIERSAPAWTPDVTLANGGMRVGIAATF
jgi:hypothetical protein